MAKGTIRFWAAAQAAAGVAEEPYDAETLADALAKARAQRGSVEFDKVLKCSSYLVDGNPVGSREHLEIMLPEGGVVEVLPPFAGG